MFLIVHCILHLRAGAFIVLVSYSFGILWITCQNILNFSLIWK